MAIKTKIPKEPKLAIFTSTRSKLDQICLIKRWKLNVAVDVAVAVLIDRDRELTGKVK